MPATKLPSWPTPTDYYPSPTSQEQEQTEQDIDSLFRPLRPDHLNLVPSHHRDQIFNPWLQDPTSSSPPPPPSDARKDDDSGPPLIPTLKRSQHLKFLSKWIDPMPAAYLAFDTNRPWLLYWVLHSYDLLSASLDDRGIARSITTLLSFQNKQTGGFGGGPGQVSHLMGTYAAVCALSIVGGPGGAPDPQHVERGESVKVGKGGWDEIDRVKMYEWMMSLKQPDGSFLVHENGEVDVRASYCVITVSTLLGICTPELVRGMGDFIASCQTYEGGLSASSQPTYDGDGSLLVGCEPPALGEAHGGYTFCAVATHLVLDCLPPCGQGPILPFLKHPPSSLSNFQSDPFHPSNSKAQEKGGERLSSAGNLNLDSLVRWATSQQGLPIEGGGFRGRTNKLVDGCYGWFSGGGLFSCLDAILTLRSEREGASPVQTMVLKHDFGTRVTSETDSEREEDESVIDLTRTSEDKGGDEEADPSDEKDWISEPDSPPRRSKRRTSFNYQDEDPSKRTLFDRRSLQEYILIAAQQNEQGWNSRNDSGGGGGGGLRDKPGKRPDAYHTCYNLSGLSLCQNSVVRSEGSKTLLEKIWETRGTKREEWEKRCYVESLAWSLDDPQDSRGNVVGDDAEQRRTNKVNPTHPVFNLCFNRVKAIMDWSYRIA
ncbi:terpenoid cyclases/Protein prenyltransferase [Violaceomyces palustris]|uniref:Terpenoid cyclases/Protein prenyltransferase n=1 Tax=Violaceomyces palustris TaxID=1673888 RepID=A0ACD0NYE1_9BASI|nr:terpenoid cyclases/Protein prenyltransferase [Violaceomyces palustris]